MQKPIVPSVIQQIIERLAMSEPSESNGADGDRTHNLHIANVALSQLSYGPTFGTPIVSDRRPCGKQNARRRLPGSVPASAPAVLPRAGR